MSKNETALLLIDVQQAFKNEAYWGGNRNNPQAEQNIDSLLSEWRRKGWPIIHVKHNSRNPHSLLHATNAGNQIMSCAMPIAGEPLFEKQVNSAFIGTQLQAYLEEQGIKSLLIVGFITNHCVSTTARMAGNYGFKVFVAADATATFDRIGHDGVLYKSEEVHRISLANLHEEFATIVHTADMLTNVEVNGHVNV
ncbi:cysteine hydrolase family protein [Pontibacter sp. MBLB2868]|uniref:cysteine hydrolase family protein n=1 Tax=Pontibacter sp. MBLB2868 TaxID=3451555 RepID=UPI003F756C0F